MKKQIVLVCILMVGISAFSQEKPRLMSRSLLHSTVRLEVQKSGGVATGTGFVYFFSNKKDENKVIPVIVTCWHVVEGGSYGRFFFSQVSSNAALSATNRIGAIIPNFQNAWFRHPDTNVDLAIMPIGPYLHQLEDLKKVVDVTPISSTLISSEQELEGFGVFQEVKFIGYPIGIWDEKNNLPVVRRGMTATDPTVDYNGNTEFLIDAAVFPGSSGSPVFVADEGGSFRNGGLYGPRLKLLGILYAVEEFTSEGKIEVITIPTAFDMKVHTRIPANLGVVIKATRLNDFNAVLDEMIKKDAEMAHKTGNKGTGSSALPP